MNNFQQADRKRDNYKREIRRKHVQQILVEKRKKFMSFMSIDKQQQGLRYEPANALLMKRSLIKNELNYELQTLLPSLRNKIYKNKQIASIEFVLSVSCNILRDDISLQQKQYIYGYCRESIIQVGPKNISPLVQLYFYETLMLACYQYFDQKMQSQIESEVITRLLQLFSCRQINTHRVPQKYTPEQIKLLVIEEVLSSLLHFYKPDRDHNVILLYKVKRTAQFLDKIIKIFKEHVRQAHCWQYFKEIMVIFNQLVVNILSIQSSLCCLIQRQSVIYLVQIMLDQINRQQQEEQHNKIIVCKALAKLLKQDDLYANNWSIFKIDCTALINHIQDSTNDYYRIELMQVLKEIMLNESLTQLYYESQLNILCEHIMSSALNILQVNQYSTEINILARCLELIKFSLSFNYQRGNSQMARYFSNIGGYKLIDAIFAKQKNESVIQDLNDIYQLLQIG